MIARLLTVSALALALLWFLGLGAWCVVFYWLFIRPTRKR
jgi:hypothetical protein